MGGQVGGAGRGQGCRRFWPVPLGWIWCLNGIRWGNEDAVGVRLVDPCTRLSSTSADSHPRQERITGATPRRSGDVDLDIHSCSRSNDLCSDLNRDTLIEEDPHAAKVEAVNSRTLSTWASSTPGNHSRNSETVAPLSRFLNKAATGTRVPRNFQAPPQTSGTRSIPGHWDHSVMSRRCRSNQGSQGCRGSDGDRFMGQATFPDGAASATRRRWNGDRTSPLRWDGDPRDRFTVPAPGPV